MTRSRRHLAISPFLLGAVVLLTVACSGDGGGCSGLSPLPNGRYEGPKTDNAVTVRVSPHGVNYLNQNWRSLIEAFAPNSTMTFDVGCAVQNLPLVGDVVLADQGPQGCTDEYGSCGRMDGKCCPTGSAPGCNGSVVDRPATVAIKVLSLALNPVAPDRLQAVVDLEIRTGEIFFSTVNRKPGVCGGVACLFAWGIGRSRVRHR